MIGDEPYGNYNRIMLSHVLAGEATVDDDDLMLNPMAWYREHGVTLYAGDRAEAIDRFAKTVTCASGGRAIDFDVLVIATGSHTFFPNMDGLREPDGKLARGVFGFRTIEDTNGMLQMATSRDHMRAVVIGGGLLGLEAAYGLQTQGVAVDVVHSPGHLMNQQLDERGGTGAAEQDRVSRCRRAHRQAHDVGTAQRRRDGRGSRLHRRGIRCRPT